MTINCTAIPLRLRIAMHSILTSLNIFKNTIDVNGARAIREILKVNQAIQFLDIGHNRIRQKGFERRRGKNSNAVKNPLLY